MSNYQSLKNIDLNHLVVFVVIAESKSLTEASQRLNSDKTRVSRILTALEQSLEQTLCIRNTRHFRLTDAGRKLYEHSQKIVNEAIQIKSTDSTRDQLEGTIRIALAHGISERLLPAPIAEFRKMHPKVQFQFVFSQNKTDFIREDIDLAFRLGNLQDSSLKALKVGMAGLIFVATPKFLECYPSLKTPQDLKKIPLILMPHYDQGNLSFKSESKSTSVSLQADLVANSPSFVFNLVHYHLGAGLIPEFLCREDLQRGNLVKVIPEWELASVPISLVSPYQKNQPAHVEAFMAFLAKSIRSTLES